MRKKIVSSGLLLLLQLGVLASCFSGEPLDTGGPIDVDCNTTAPPANTRIVRIENFAFQPAELRVPPGTRVVWLNCEPDPGPGFAHTATADDGTWTSQLLAPQGAGGFARTFEQAGSFPYHCQPHPVMTARIIVE